MKNKYQTLFDYIIGRWRCPKCRTCWTSMSFFNNCVYATIIKGKITEERIECPRCGIIEVVKKCRI